MRLANRMDRLKEEGAFEMMVKAQELEASGRSIIHFEIGQPDFPTPKNIVDAAITALKAGKTRYAPPLGIPELREAIAEEVSKTRGVKITRNQVAVTPGPKSAIYLAMAAICEQGDEVIYPNPGFPAYQNLIDFFDCKPKPVQLLEEHGFSFDMRVFESFLSKKTKLVILNSPSNPTGGVMPQEDLERIVKLCKDLNCWILSDEIYSRILYDALEHESIYKNPQIQEKVMMIDGISKTYAATGWRLGFLIFPEEIVEKIDYLITNTFSCTAAFTQYAAVEALKGSQGKVVRMVSEFEKRRNLIVEELNTIPGIICTKPQGAFYVFPSVKSFKKTSKELADYLLQEGVALLDGTSFGEYGEGYLRLSYVTSLENIKVGLYRIKMALSKLKL